MISAQGDKHDDRHRDELERSFRRLNSFINYGPVVSVYQKNNNYHKTKLGTSNAVMKRLTSNA